MYPDAAGVRLGIGNDGPPVCASPQGVSVPGKKGMAEPWSGAESGLVLSECRGSEWRVWKREYLPQPSQGERCNSLQLRLPPRRYLMKETSFLFKLRYLMADVNS